MVLISFENREIEILEVFNSSKGTYTVSLFAIGKSLPPHPNPNPIPASAQPIPILTLLGDTSFTIGYHTRIKGMIVRYIG